MSSVTFSSTRLGGFLLRSRRWVVLAMLLALHEALIVEPGSDFQRIWLLVHFGLFLMWQPFFASDQEVSRFAIVLLVAITGTVLFFLPGWLIGAWICVLMGILGGKVFTAQAARRGRFYLVAFFYLAAMMLLWTVPRLVLKEPGIPEPVAVFCQLVLPVSLLALAFLPFDPLDDDSRQVFDFFYAVLVFQLVVVLVLGSIALMRYTEGGYFRSAGLTVIGFGATLFVLAVFWGPREGYGGLRTYLSRYLMSVGMPFEIWVRRVAELAEHEPDPQRFLGQALAQVNELPWVKGGRWKTAEGEGEFGVASKEVVRFGFHGLELTFHTEIALSPALFLHMRLLAQVVGEFYESKRRESAMRRNAYLQAVHETGARLTHDIKNLLQSLFALTSAAPRGGERDPAYGDLLQRQLPQLTRRLQSTLDQLRSPQVETRESSRPARAWWQDVERRHAAGGLAFEAAIEGEATIPANLFDAFLENCLDNARKKGGEGVRMKVSLEVAAGRVELSFENSGPALPESVSRNLFHEPVVDPSAGGLGIGLYQVARLAAQSAYAVELAVNEPGRVVFRLHPA
ncbi:MAG: ATP-binding protein [Burkholderiales bacterium]